MSRLVRFIEANPEPDNGDDRWDEWWNDYQDEVDREFPEYPFDIILGGEDLVKLDKPFMDVEHSDVWIKHKTEDGEFVMEINVQDMLYFLNWNSHIRPVTLRMVLEAMGSHPGYRKYKEKTGQTLMLTEFSATTVDYVFIAKYDYGDYCDYS